MLTNKTSGWKNPKKKVPNPPSTIDTSPLLPSLFSNVPPTLNFTLHKKVESNHLPKEVTDQLTWKLSKDCHPFIKSVASDAGFRLMLPTSDFECTAIFTEDLREVPVNDKFQDLKSGQKINRFPGTGIIGRKYDLFKLISQMRLKFGDSEFGFHPMTFCLPFETKMLKKVWSKEGVLTRWIVKPITGAEGRGIKVVSNWQEISNTGKPYLVQRYIHQPFLINNTKFDLRLYVLVTSVDPLHIFLYDDGLIRFATNKYTNDIKSVADIYTHITNTSINKKADLWTLKSLWGHFDNEGIDHFTIWQKIKDIIVKTIMSPEKSVAAQLESNVKSRYSCYEFYGFDILLDVELKPWLLEVNRFPGTGWARKIAGNVKRSLLTEIFNVARYHLPSNVPQSTQMEIADRFGYDKNSLCLDDSLYSKELTNIEKIKQNFWLTIISASITNVPPPGILDDLTQDDIRHLLVAEDELAISKNFLRIFPTNTTHKYLKFMKKPRYYNLLLGAWEIKYAGINREKGRSVLEQLCAHNRHLKIPTKYLDVKPKDVGSVEPKDEKPKDMGSVDVKRKDIRSAYERSMDVASVESILEKIEEVKPVQKKHEDIISELSDSEEVEPVIKKKVYGYCCIL